MVRQLVARGETARALASAVILAANDDAENVDAALTARRIRPGVPIVARVFDPSLGQYLEETEDGLRVLSVSASARPLSRSRILPRRVDPILVRLALVAALVIVFSVWFYARVLGVSLFDAFYFVVETITNTGYGDFAIREAGASAKLVAILLMIGGAGLLALVYALVTGWFIARRIEIIQGRLPERGRGHAVIAGAGNVGFPRRAAARRR